MTMIFSFVQLVDLNGKHHGMKNNEWGRIPKGLSIGMWNDFYKTNYFCTISEIYYLYIISFIIEILILHSNITKVIERNTSLHYVFVKQWLSDLEI